MSAEPALAPDRSVVTDLAMASNPERAELEQLRRQLADRDARVVELEAKATADEEKKRRLEAEALALREGGGPVVEVTLGGNKHRLVMYGSIADRVTLCLYKTSVPGCEYKALWAALGLAVPHIRQIVPYRGNPLTFGTDVANKLFDEKLNALEITQAGKVAYDFLTADLPMVDGSADFSGTPPAGSNGGDGSSGDSSRSSAPTGGSPGA